MAWPPSKCTLAPLLLLSHWADLPTLLGRAKVLEGAHSGCPGDRKKSQLPWGDGELWHFKHLSQGNTRSPQGPAPVPGLGGGREGDQQPGKNASPPVKHIRQLP